MRGAPTRLEMFVLRTARPPLHAAVTPRPAPRARGTRSPRRRRRTGPNRCLCGCVYTHKKAGV